MVEEVSGGMYNISGNGDMVVTELYNTRSMRLTEVACKYAVLASACPPGKGVSHGATRFATAMYTSSSTLPLGVYLS